MNNSSINSTLTETQALDDIVGFSVALGINFLVAMFAILVFLLNRACVLPILIFQSLGFQIVKKVKKSTTLVNTFSILDVSTSNIPKLIVLTLVVAFIILRVAMLVFRVIQYSLYGESTYSAVGAIGSVLLILGGGCNVSVFSTFLLLWIQFIYSINKAQRIIHPAGFVLFLVIMVVANIIVWIACIAVAITFAIPKETNANSTILILTAAIPGSVFVLGIGLVDLVMIVSGIAIITMLVKSYHLQKRMLKNVVDQDQQTQLLNHRTKQLTGLAARFAVVIVMFLFSINMVILGLVIIAVGARAWIITMFMQTIPECLAVLSMCIFFVPLRQQKIVTEDASSGQTKKEEEYSKVQSMNSCEVAMDEKSESSTPQSPNAEATKIEQTSILEF